MKPKTKTAVLLLFTLLIGIVLGLLLRPLIFSSHYDDFRKLRRPGGITERIEKMLELNESQMKIIKPILESHEAKLRQSGENARAEFNRLMDSLNTELKEYLTPEQIEKLEGKFRDRRDLEGHKKRSKKFQEEKLNNN